MRKSHKPGGAEWLCGSVRKENTRLSVRGCLLWLGEKKRAPNYSWNSLKLLPSGFTFYAGWPCKGALSFAGFSGKRKGIPFLIWGVALQRKQTNSQPCVLCMYGCFVRSLRRLARASFCVCVCSFARCLCVCCVPYALRVLRV